jgi:hypothetical protein
MTSLSRRTVVALLLASLLAVAPYAASGAEAAAPAESAVAAEEAGVAEYTQGRCAAFGHIEAASAIVFFVVALLLGLIAYHPLAWLPVPYTAILLVSTGAVCRQHVTVAYIICLDVVFETQGCLCRPLELCSALRMRLAQSGGCWQRASASGRWATPE